VSYDLATGRFEELACVVPPEGIITMNMDTKNEVLYGLTWPSGLLVVYDIRTRELRSWGAVQAQGEWGPHPWEWNRICRQLAIHPDGKVYGSTMHGRIWQYDPARIRRVRFIEGLDLSRVPFTQSAEEAMKGDFQHNWRVITWNPDTKSFWGLHFETTTLFEFIPETNYVRARAELRPEAYRHMPRNPEVSQLGFMLGPKNTLFYLAHGPAVDLPDRPALQSGLYLMTYDIAKKRPVNHGPILSSDRRRVFFTESIAIGPDDRIYTVAWVEALASEEELTGAEAAPSGPEETAASNYEMLLVRLPAWQAFVE
jgi:hypothetical protein